MKPMDTKLKSQREDQALMENGRTTTEDVFTQMIKMKETENASSKTEQPG